MAESRLRRTCVSAIVAFVLAGISLVSASAVSSPFSSSVLGPDIGGYPMDMFDSDEDVYEYEYEFYDDNPVEDDVDDVDDDVDVEMSETEEEFFDDLMEELGELEGDVAEDREKQQFEQEEEDEDELDMPKHKEQTVEHVDDPSDEWWRDPFTQFDEEEGADLELPATEAAELIDIGGSERDDEEETEKEKKRAPAPPTERKPENNRSEKQSEILQSLDVQDSVEPIAEQQSIQDMDTGTETPNDEPIEPTPFKELDVAHVPPPYTELDVAPVSPPYTELDAAPVSPPYTELDVAPVSPPYTELDVAPTSPPYKELDVARTPISSISSTRAVPALLLSSVIPRLRKSIVDSSSGTALGYFASLLAFKLAMDRYVLMPAKNHLKNTETQQAMDNEGGEGSDILDDEDESVLFDEEYSDLGFGRPATRRKRKSSVSTDSNLKKTPVESTTVPNDQVGVERKWLNGPNSLKIIQQGAMGYLARRKEKIRREQGPTIKELQDQVEQLLDRTGTAESQRDSMEKDYQTSARKLQEVQSQMIRLASTTKQLREQLRESQQSLDSAVQVERRKANDELARVREAMVTVLERERRLMRVQVMKQAAEVRSLLREQQRPSTSTPQFSSQGKDDEVFKGGEE
eukprot:scaffold31138_cov58-Attheya_sp.AAC.1